MNYIYAQFLFIFYKGVELSNIIKDLILSDPSKQHSISKCVTNLKNTLENADPDFSQLEGNLKVLKVLKMKF